MKNICLLAAIICTTTITLTASAQRGGAGRNEGPSFGWSGAGLGNGIPTLYGVSLGINYATIRGGTGVLAGKSGWQPGLCGSAFIAIPVTQAFYARTGFGFSMQGVRGPEYSLRAWYFELPLMADFRLSGGSDFHLLAGPQLNFLMAATGVDHGVKSDMYQEIKENNLSLAAGIDWLPRGRWGAGVRGQLGLFSIDNANKTPIGGRTGSVSLSMVYRFGK